MKKIKVLLVCVNDLARSLLVSRFQKMSQIDFIGSSGDRDNTFRLIKIYDPDVVFFGSFDDKKGCDYRLVQDIRDTTKSKIIVLLSKFSTFDSRLFFRYGATSITCLSGGYEDLIIDTYNQKYTTQFPSCQLYKIPDLCNGNVVTINNKYRGYIENFVAYNTKWISKQKYAYGKPYLEIHMKSFFKLSKVVVSRLIQKLKSTRELPENNLELTDYFRLFPENFLRVKFYGKDMDKQRFIFVSNKDIKDFVSKYNPFEKEDLMEFNNYTFDFETSKKFKFRV